VNKANNATFLSKATGAVPAVALALALSLPLASAAPATPEASPTPAPSHECYVWAGIIEAPAGDYRMQMIGCDEWADGSYTRAEGRCNAIARDAWREHHNLYSIKEEVQKVMPSCYLYEDGSWSHQ